jgi:polygalacturonase
MKTNSASLYSLGARLLLVVLGLMGNPARATLPTADEIVTTVLAHAPQIPAVDFPVRAYGAKGDGRTDDLPALRQAVRAAHDAGGGRVVVAPGTYHLAGPLVMLSGVEVHVEAGATLSFSPDPAHYLPPVLMRWEGTLMFGHSPMIYAAYATDIALTGQGTIDGNGGEVFAGWRAHQKPDQQALREMGGLRHVPLANRVFGGGHFLRPSMIQFLGCTRVKIAGLTIVDSPFWVVHPVFCRYVHVTGITVDSQRLNNDGVDPDSCAYVLIEHSRFRTGDDAVAIKAGRDHDARQLAVRSEHIVVRHCEFEKVHNGVAIGSEMSGGVRNVHVHDCRIGQGGNLIFFKSNLDRGGVIEDVHVRDIQVDVARETLVRFMTTYHSWRGDHFPTTFRRFLVERVSCREVQGIGIWAEGHAEAPLQDIVLRDITIERVPRPLRVRPGDAVVLEKVRAGGKLIAPTDSEPLSTPAELGM